MSVLWSGGVSCARNVNHKCLKFLTQKRTLVECLFCLLLLCALFFFSFVCLSVFLFLAGVTFIVTKMAVENTNPSSSSQNNNNNTNNTNIPFDNEVVNKVLSLFRAVESEDCESALESETSDFAGVFATTRLSAPAAPGAKPEWIGYSPLGWATHNDKHEAVKEIMEFPRLSLWVDSSPCERSPLALAANHVFHSDLHSLDARVNTLCALVGDHSFYRRYNDVRCQCWMVDSSWRSGIVANIQESLLTNCTNAHVVRAMFGFMFHVGYPLNKEYKLPSGHLTDRLTMLSVNSDWGFDGFEELARLLIKHGGVLPLSDAWTDFMFESTSGMFAWDVVLSNGGLPSAGLTVGLFQRGKYKGGLHVDVVNACLSVFGASARSFFLKEAVRTNKSAMVGLVRASGPVQVDDSLWLSAVESGSVPLVEALFQCYKDQLSRRTEARMVRQAVYNRKDGDGCSTLLCLTVERFLERSDHCSMCWPCQAFQWCVLVVRLWACSYP